jgi:hypothetical protein
MRILTCYAAHHNVLCFHFWQGLFSITAQRYGSFLMYKNIPCLVLKKVDSPKAINVKNQRLKRVNLFQYKTFFIRGRSQVYINMLPNTHSLTRTSEVYYYTIIIESIFYREVTLFGNRYLYTLQHFLLSCKVQKVTINLKNRPFHREIWHSRRVIIGR